MHQRMLLADEYHFPWEVTAYVLERTWRASTVHVPEQTTIIIPHCSAPGLRQIAPGQIGTFRVSGQRLRYCNLFPGRWVREVKG